MIQRGIYSRIMVSIYYILYYKHRVEVYYIYVFLFFTVLAKVTYCDLIARGGRASFNRKLYYFLITFFVSSTSRGEKQQCRAHLAPHGFISHIIYIHLCILVSYIYIMNRYILYMYIVYIYMYIMLGAIEIFLVLYIIITMDE